MKNVYKKSVLFFLLLLLLTGCKKNAKITDEGAVLPEEIQEVSGNDVQSDGSDISENHMIEETIAQDEMYSFVDVYGVQYEAVLDQAAQKHIYDWDYLSADGQYKYYKAPGFASRLGIDVSKFQGEIDWNKVSAQGISYAFIRVGNRGYGQEGSLNTDGRYLENIEGAKAAGIDVGVYFYSQAISEKEALEEADYLLSLIEGISLECPVVYDAEYVTEDEARTDSVTKEQFTQNALAFCQRIESAGYEPIIYATMKWEAYALQMSEVSQYVKWYADYEDMPQTPYDFTYWQYTNEAEIEGIDGPVDLNLEIIPLAQRQNEILSKMTLEEKVAQLFIVTPDALTGINGMQTGGEALRTAFLQYPVGGLIYFKENLADRDQTKAFLEEALVYGKAASKTAPFLAVDEEGGSVVRIADNPLMGVPNVGNMADIGRMGQTEKAYDAGNTIGLYLDELGFNLNFAPDSDVLTNPENTVVQKRSFGADPSRVSAMSKAYLDGLTQNHILGVYKHYPGHGATEGDSHEGYAYTSKTLEELKQADFIPFMDATKSGVPIIMAGHISAPNVTNDELPASLSHKLITDILREDLGFDGLVITDALNMGAIVEKYGSAEACVMALEAGCDMLLMPADFKAAYEGVLKAVKDGRISEDILDRAVLKILEVKLQGAIG